MRSTSYGQNNKPTIFDRFGIYLSSRRLIKELVNTPNQITGKLLDLGAGFNMRHTAELSPFFDEATAVDVALNEKILPSVIKKIGLLEHITPELAENEYSAVVLNSVLEHINEPQPLLNQCYRLLAPNGIFYISVPPWREKFFLEFTAFTLKHPQARIEMNDHKMYYDKRDLWPMLVKAGFLPEDIRLTYYKFGLSLLGICRKRANTDE
jgi:SAM-dependent methyltransferase